jgi:PQQ-dependent catabolism-associated CXXCW motif protein
MIGHQGRLRVLVVLVAVIAGFVSPAFANSPVEPRPVEIPRDYKLDDYKSPTPPVVPGGTPVNTAEAKALWDGNDAIFIDVLPAPIRPPGLAPDQMWAPKPRRDIPGSVWLPDVGRGALNDATDRYFRTNLSRLTHDHFDQAIVIYCLADCWMSWNAVKRAASYGYTKVYWYRDGTDGWSDAGLPVELAHEIPQDQ